MKPSYKVTCVHKKFWYFRNREVTLPTLWHGMLKLAEEKNGEAGLSRKELVMKVVMVSYLYSAHSDTGCSPPEVFPQSWHYPTCLRTATPSPRLGPSRRSSTNPHVCGQLHLHHIFATSHRAGTNPHGFVDSCNFTIDKPLPAELVLPHLAEDSCIFTIDLSLPTDLALTHMAVWTAAPSP
ncbi:hypothetical protein J6590_096891 [Homalodisca vitripennis]|nr:hypothetical protein J6590_025956 [Homalodisca vitripennis]KAG8274955.1 hypothetical protein J6590_096891 [Homalodisca vitripennis]